MNKSSLSPRLGTLLIVSGPSGSGKTTLCRRAMLEGLCRYSISCTTRSPRPGEQNGVDYHFLSPQEFESKVQAGEFLEHATVHGNRYGTLNTDIIPLLQQGITVIMDIDVQGAAQVRANRTGIIALCYADVYIHVPFDILKQRLCNRNTDSPETIALRLRNAAEEQARLPEYGYCLISGDREADYAAFCALLRAQNMRVALQQIAPATV